MTDVETALNRQAWLVSARTDVQYLLVNVKSCVDHIDSSSSIVKSDVDLVRNAADCAFSLWRAVFLISEDFDNSRVIEQLQGFLKATIDDNSVQYMTDKHARFYTAGYYLRNAYLRLENCEQNLTHKIPPKDQSAALKKFVMASEVLLQSRSALAKSNVPTLYRQLFESTLDASIKLVELLAAKHKISPVRTNRKSRYVE
jgi:hypothetical protein